MCHLGAICRLVIDAGRNRPTSHCWPTRALRRASVPRLIKPMTHWRCISGCGACCRLDPSLRGDDLGFLDPEQQRTYLSMVGEDGWCIHFDTGGRRCRIYASRPDFCRVENLMSLFAPQQAPAERDKKAADQGGVGNPVDEDRTLSGSPEPSNSTGAGVAALDPAAQALAIASCRTQIRAEYGGRGRVMKRFEQAIRRAP